MDTVLFTDNQVLVFAIAASAISLVLYGFTCLHKS